MIKIKFGMDGWCVIIVEDYMVENVKWVVVGIVIWMKVNDVVQVVIGYDVCFGGELFVYIIIWVMGVYGMKVKLVKGFVFIFMVFLGVVKIGLDLGVVIMVSYNLFFYNGFKLKFKLGGLMIFVQVVEVELYILNIFDRDLLIFQEMEVQGLLEYVDLEQIYVDYVIDSFDLESICNVDFKIVYDVMYGVGQNVLCCLLFDVVLLYCDYNFFFMGQVLEFIYCNFGEFFVLIKNDFFIGFGFVNDGDVDCIGMYDEDGNFVDFYYILLLLLFYMYEYKKQIGKVVVIFFVMEKMQELVKQFGLDIEVIKIGFKYIVEIMVQEFVLVGGEEFGGFVVSGYILECDGIWIGLIIMEFMVKIGKFIKELIQEVYDWVGFFVYDWDDLYFMEVKKQLIIKQCQEGSLKVFGFYQVEYVEDIDGFKFYFGGSCWVMICFLGIELVFWVYVQVLEYDEVC